MKFELTEREWKEAKKFYKKHDKKCGIGYNGVQFGIKHCWEDGTLFVKCSNCREETWISHWPLREDEVLDFE